MLSKNTRGVILSCTGVPASLWRDGLFTGQWHTIHIRECSRLSNIRGRQHRTLPANSKVACCTIQHKNLAGDLNLVGNLIWWTICFSGELKYSKIINKM